MNKNETMSGWNSWNPGDDDDDDAPLTIEKGGKNLNQNTVTRSESLNLGQRSTSRRSSSSRKSIVSHIKNLTPRPNSWNVEGIPTLATTEKLPTISTAAFLSPIKLKPLAIKPKNGGSRKKKARKAKKARRVTRVSRLRNHRNRQS
jgi:hypothetical protein